MLKDRRFRSCWSFGNPMSLRFDDGAEPDKDKDEAAKKAEAARQVEFDKARQVADQAEANARKAREQAEAYQAQLEQANAARQEMQAKLDKLEQQAASKDIDLDLNEDDFEGSDVTLVKAIKLLRSGIADRDKKLASLEKKATEYETERQKEAEKEASNSAYEELLTELDSDYGAQYRNTAVKMFNALCAEGKVPKGNPAKATRALERCYKEARAQAEKDKTNKTNKDDENVSFDTGSGGGGAPNLGGNRLKPGSLEEVSAQLQAANNSS